jgi:hypothetical protein
VRGLGGRAAGASGSWLADASGLRAGRGGAVASVFKRFVGRGLLDTSGLSAAALSSSVPGTLALRFATFLAFALREDEKE